MAARAAQHNGGLITMYFNQASKMPNDILDHPCAVCGGGNVGGMRRVVHRCGVPVAAICDECAANGRDVEVIDRLDRRKFARLAFLLAVIVAVALIWWLV